MIKNYTVTATLVTHYAKEFIFDTDIAECWRKYLPEDIAVNLKWEDLSGTDQEKVLNAFIEDLENESIDPDRDRDVYEETSGWDNDVMVNET